MNATQQSVAFCASCGERDDLCRCEGARVYVERGRAAFERLHDETRRAARSLAARPGERRPALAAVLSVLVPGLGQLYNGEVLKAVVFFLGWVLLIPWPLAVLDAYTAARIANLEERLRQLGDPPLDPEGSNQGLPGRKVSHGA